ncbi:MAG: hypothetical protein JWM27_2935 [Gemmatimonadetes bacterium]|nr:hypothetical protein [Gemmatimonadota bacterium]
MNTPTVTLSSNTLFHFTRTLDTLLSILTHEFRPRFSKETLPVHGDTLINGIPMTCFCDIPLSQTQAHMSMYGNYALGLTKEWGMRNSVCPVLYGVAPSPITDGLYRVMKGGLGLRGPLTRGSKVDEKLWKDIYRISCYVKPYEAPFLRNGTVHPNVRFYDEREWRWVPDVSGTRFEFGIDESQCDDPVSLSAANNQLWNDARLSFEPSDIRYILVASEAEILPMIDHIRNIKAKYSDTEKNLLMTRLTSAEQVRADF